MIGGTVLSHPWDHDRRILIENMITKYSGGLFPSTTNNISTKPQQENPGDVVLLTGSTGNLGSEILKLLCSDNVNVTKVYALNRRSSEQSIYQRHATQLKCKGIDAEFLKSQKLVFLEGDTTLPNFDLDLVAYEELRDSITLVIHNAWPINLSQSLAFFEPCLIGLRNLVDLARSSPRSSQPRFLFISSVLAGQSWNDKDGAPVPEIIIHDTGAAIGFGYGESKFIAEQIVSKSGLNATCLRVSQLYGRSQNGAWSISEWVPILVRASIEIGVFPDIAGLVAWIPLDDAARCILDVAFSQKLHEVLNLAHPRPVRWSTIMDHVEDALVGGGYTLPLPTVPFLDWVSILRVSKKGSDFRTDPATKLLTSFQLLALENQATIAAGRQDVDYIGAKTLSTQKAREIISTLHNLKQLNAEDARRWVEYWGTLRFVIIKRLCAKL